VLQRLNGGRGQDGLIVALAHFSGRFWPTHPLGIHSGGSNRCWAPFDVALADQQTLWPTHPFGVHSVQCTPCVALCDMAWAHRYWQLEK